MATLDKPKVTLHWLSKSRAQRLVWLLEELKLDYDVVIYRRDKNDLAPVELQKVHTLGKSPVITIVPPGPADAKPIVLAESGFMTEWLCEHFPTEGSKLFPKKWKDGKEGQFGGETDEWMRHQYFMHYAEGSWMMILVVARVMNVLRGPQIPFFVRPITSIVAGQIFSAFVAPSVKRHLQLMEENLAASSPNGDKFISSEHLRAADILISFGLISGKDQFDSLSSWKGGSWRKEFPLVSAYVDRLEKEPSYIRSLQKIKELDSDVPII